MHVCIRRWTLVRRLLSPPEPLPNPSRTVFDPFRFRGFGLFSGCMPGKRGRYPFPGRSNQPRLIPTKAGIKGDAHIGGAGVADMGLSTDAVV